MSARWRWTVAPFSSRHALTPRENLEWSSRTVRGVAAMAAGHGEVALEVHLPQVVRVLMLEALVALGLGARGRLYEPVASEDGVDGALRGHGGVAPVAEHPGNHVGALGGTLQPQLHHRLLHFMGGAVRRAARTLGQVLQGLVSPLQVSTQPLVAGLAADAEATTQLANVGPVHPGQGHELFTLGHDGVFPPRHGLPPRQVFHALSCNPSLRTGVTHVPGPYNGGRLGWGCLRLTLTLNHPSPAHPELVEGSSALPIPHPR